MNTFVQIYVNTYNCKKILSKFISLNFFQNYSSYMFSGRPYKSDQAPKVLDERFYLIGTMEEEVLLTFKVFSTIVNFTGRGQSPGLAPLSHLLTSQWKVSPHHRFACWFVASTRQEQQYDISRSLAQKYWPHPMLLNFGVLVGTAAVQNLMHFERTNG